jgi:hypothetical protein
MRLVQLLGYTLKERGGQTLASRRRTADSDQPAIYCIQVKGKLDVSWADWFGVTTMRVRRSARHGPVTTLVGEVVDQAALYGWLARLRDLGLLLLLVKYLKASPGMGKKDE